MFPRNEFIRGCKCHSTLAVGEGHIPMWTRQCAREGVTTSNQQHEVCNHIQRPSSHTGHCNDPSMELAASFLHHNRRHSSPIQVSACRAVRAAALLGAPPRQSIRGARRQPEQATGSTTAELLSRRSRRPTDLAAPARCLTQVGTIHMPCAGVHL